MVDVLASLPDMVLLVDRGGTIRYVNRASESLFGYSPDDLVGDALSVLLPPEIWGRHVGMMKTFFDRPEPRSMGERPGIIGMHRDGSRVPVDIKLTPLPREDGDWVVAVIRDVTHLRKAQLQIEEYASRLQDMNLALERMMDEATRHNQELTVLNDRKNELLGVVAHDLRNPIAGIRGFAQLLERGVLGELTERQHTFAQHLLQSSNYMLELVNGLVDLTAVESGRLSLERCPTDVVALTRDIVELEKVLAEARRVQIAFTNDGAPESAFVDPHKIQQVFRNLLGNAVKYSPEGSVVEVRLHGGPGEFAIDVVDEGPGIDPAELDDLFAPFRRGGGRKQVGTGGVGLGLAIAKKIVDGHRGRIEVDSEVGRGSVFRVVVPTTE